MSVKCVSLDWLQFSVRGNIGSYERQKSFNFVLKGSTPQFSQWYVVEYDGRAVFDVCAVPHSSIIKPDTINVRVYNSILYDAEMFSIVRKLLNVCKWKYSNLTRVDIAYDCQDIDFDRFVVECINGKIDIDGNHSYSFFWRNERSRRVAETFHINKPSSPISLKMYDKTLEMERKGQKKYITDMWQLAGMDITKRVVRVEISIRNVYEIVERDVLSDVFDFEREGFTSSLFCALMNRFVFTRESAFGEEERIKIVDVDNIYEIKLVRKYPESRSVRQTRYIANQIKAYSKMNANTLSEEMRWDIDRFVNHFVRDCTYIDRRLLEMTDEEIRRYKNEIKANYEYGKIIFKNE